MSENGSNNGTRRMPILLIEDTQAGYIHCRKLLQKKFDIYIARDSSEVLGVLEKMIANDSPPRGVIVDLTLVSGYREGVDLIKYLKGKHPKIPILVWTKHSDEVIKKALEAGAQDFIKKHTDAEKQMESVLLGMINPERT